MTEVAMGVISFFVVLGFFAFMAAFVKGFG